MIFDIASLIMAVAIVLATGIAVYCQYRAPRRIGPLENSVPIVLAVALICAMVTLISAYAGW